MKTVIVFLLMLALCALLAWVGGFNFDQRNVDVAMSTFLAIFFSGMVAMFVTMD